MPASQSRYEVLTTRSPRQTMSVWPMDLALLAISALIMVIVLKYFRFTDSRWMYNAWTYLIGVPSIMIALSMLLHLTTGRLIERSLQLSFLGSVLVHLLILVGTLNVVIFAKYWPDVYDSVVNESTPQKSVTAEFHRAVASNSKRPDFLKPVPTESESEERPTPRARREQVVDLPPVDLPTDTQMTRSEDPFLIPKPTPNPEQPMPTSSSAELRRQKLQDAFPSSSRSIDLPESQPEAKNVEPTAREGDVARSQPLESVAALQPMSLPQRDKELEAPSSRVDPQPRARVEQLPDLSSIESKLPKVERERATFSDRMRETQIPLPEGSYDRPSGNEVAQMEARSESVQKQTAREQRLSATADAQPQFEPALSLSKSVDGVRPDRGRLMNEATPGDLREAPSRRSAGGDTAMLPSLSKTLVGPTMEESRSSVEDAPKPSDLVASRRSNQLERSSRTSGASSLLSDARDTMPESNSGATSKGEGDVPVGLAAAKGPLDGPAIEPDPAKSSGNKGEPVRSRIGESGGNVGDPIASTIAIAPGSNSSTDGAKSVEARSLDAKSNGNRDGRKSGRDSSLAMPGLPDDTGSTLGSMATSDGVGIQAKRGNDDWMKDLEARTQGLASGKTQRGRPDGISLEGLERGSLNGPLAQSAVPVPIEEGESRGEDSKNSNPMNGPSSVADSVGARPRSGSGVPRGSGIDFGAGDLGTGKDSDASSLALERGSGGLEVRPREMELPDVRLADIQTQRFRRNDLGGPTLSGEGVPIPAPAFQRRLDRNRDPSDSDVAGALGPEVEQTIEKGLAFLAGHQRPDGSWHLEDFDTKVQIRSDTAATALALLAFQGAGYTHQQDKYAGNLARGLQYLIRNQRENGDLYARMDQSSDANAWLYSHSIASLALCESYGMTQDPQLQPAAQKAVDFMLASQDKQGGGWRYAPGTGSDTSVTGWFMMALKSAQLAGLEVDPNVFVGIRRWLDNSQASPREKHLYRYNWKAPDTVTQRHGREVTPIMTSIGLLMRLYLGWQRDDAPMRDGAEYLLDFPPAEGTVENPLRDTYYWYYATQVMFHMGGDTWKEWNGRLRPMLVESQVANGKYAGSWEPLGTIPDAWGPFGGRLYVTTLNLLSLEVYYRHLPLYEATAK